MDYVITLRSTVGDPDACAFFRGSATVTMIRTADVVELSQGAESKSEVTRPLQPQLLRDHALRLLQSFRDTSHEHNATRNVEYSKA